MKLKIKFRREVRFVPRCRQIIRPWTRLLFGTQTSMRELALAERPKPCENRFD